MTENSAVFETTIGSQQVALPITALGPDLSIALMITVDLGVRFLAKAGDELAQVLRPFNVEVVATAATMGIPIAIEVTRALGLDQYMVLHKTPKIHLADALTESVHSITTGPEQFLRLDLARINTITSRRVAFVDDVISTGSSAAAGIRLLRRAGAEVVAIAALATETGPYKDALGPDLDKLHVLGSLPIFRHNGSELVPDWG